MARPRDNGTNKPFDVVVWGATGFVGALIADYLKSNDERGKVRWALAGRNRDKLEALK